MFFKTAAALAGLVLLSSIAGAQSYYQIESNFMLTNGNAGSTTISQVEPPTYLGIIKDLSGFVRPNRIDKMTLVILITEVRGYLSKGKPSKFKAIKIPKVKRHKPVLEDDYFNESETPSRRVAKIRRHHKKTTHRNKPIIFDLNDDTGIWITTPTITKIKPPRLSIVPEKTPEQKHDSVVSAWSGMRKRLQSFVWIDYPKDGYPFYTVSFAKSTVTFINDSTFTYNERFK